MRKILVAARKGGVGKTSLAVHFAALADRPKAPALLLDCDPQGSAAFWYGRRERETPFVAKASPGEVAKLLQDAEASGVATVIIDSAPHDVGGSSTLMRLADLVVIPTRPGVLDLAAVSGTVEAARALRAPHVVVINHAPPRTTHGEPGIVAEARAALEEMGAPVLPSYVAQRASLAHSLINGTAVTEYEPDGRAAGEISAAWRAITKLADKRT